MEQRYRKRSIPWNKFQRNLILYDVTWNIFDWHANFHLCCNFMKQISCFRVDVWCFFDVWHAEVLIISNTCLKIYNIYHFILFNPWDIFIEKLWCNQYIHLIKFPKLELKSSDVTCRMSSAWIYFRCYICSLKIIFLH